MIMMMMTIKVLYFIAAKDDGGGIDSWSCRRCKAPVESSPPTNRNFYRPDALPVADNAVRCNYCFCYLSVQRFREYQTRSNLMVRLQAKYNCIEKALKGVSCPAFSSRCECLSIVVAK